MTLTGRVVAVTGAARGIGLAVAQALAAAGARVALGDLDAAAAQQAADGVGSGAVGLAVDVTDPASVAAFVTEAEARLGPLDVLVNNAGVMWVGRFADEPAAATRRMVDVNLLGVIHGFRAVAPAMRERGRGHVVTIASAASTVAPAGEATYTATKHAVHGYCAAVRAELRGSGVHVSVVMPAIVDTELATGTSSRAVRTLRPEEVAAAVVEVVTRPRFEVFVPRRLNGLTRLLALLPQRGRDVLTRVTVPDQTRTADLARRADYERRSVL